MPSYRLGVVPLFLSIPWKTQNTQKFSTACDTTKRFSRSFSGNCRRVRFFVWLYLEQPRTTPSACLRPAYRFAGIHGKTREVGILDHIPAHRFFPCFFVSAAAFRVFSVGSVCSVVPQVKPKRKTSEYSFQKKPTKYLVTSPRQHPECFGGFRISA